MMEKLIEVKPIDVKRWHGKNGKEAFAQPFVLEALYDLKTGKYATGIKDADRVKLEGLTGFNLSNDYKIDEPHPHWGSKAGQIKLENRTTIFDISKASDYVKVCVLRASKYVANSQRELDEGLFPDAVFVITDEREENKLKASKIQKKREAYALVGKMTTDEKANFIQILSNKAMRSNSQDFLDVEIDNLIESNIDSFL